MILSDKQMSVSRTALAKLEAALDTMKSQSDSPDWARQVEIDALESQKENDTAKSSYQNDVLDLSLSKGPAKLSDVTIHTRRFQEHCANAPITPVIRSRDLHWKPKHVPSFRRNAY